MIGAQADSDSGGQQQQGSDTELRHAVQLDNGSDHRAGTEIMQAEKSTRKPGFVCITLLSGALTGCKQSGKVFWRKFVKYKCVCFRADKGHFSNRSTIVIVNEE